MPPMILGNDKYKSFKSEIINLTTVNSTTSEAEILSSALMEALDMCAQSAWIAGEDGMVLYANQRMCEQVRMESAAIRGKRLADMEWGARLLESNSNLFDGASSGATIEGVIGERGGHSAGWERYTCRSLHDAAGRIVAIVCVHGDFGEEVETAGEVITMGDPSFGTPWIILMDRLEQAIDRAQKKNKKIALLNIDLQGLQAACDAGIGHAETVMNTVVQRIKQRLRRVDTIAHVDQEEFIVVLEDLAAAEDLQPVAKRLLEEFGAPVEVMGAPHAVAMHVGASCYPMHGSTADDLLESSKRALKEAKAGAQKWHVYGATPDEREK